MADPEGQDVLWMRRALRLARRGWGRTSPNPMVGALLVREGQLVGQGWHRGAGLPHAEIEAIRDARRRGGSLKEATLYVTLEPCCSHGRTPPCTEAILEAGLRRVVVAAIDPNPAHAGRGLEILRRAGLKVRVGVLAAEAARLNEAFNHWIVHRTPFVTLKMAMSLDGRIATRTGESQWLTSPAARRCAMRGRAGADAVLVGVNTVLADDPSLSVRGFRRPIQPRRIVLDSLARTPPTARVVTDEAAERTLLVLTRRAPAERVRILREKVSVWVAPSQAGRVDLTALLRHLGAQEVTHLWVEGGGHVHAAFLEAGLAHRLVAFYAPLILGGETAPRAVAGSGLRFPDRAVRLSEIEARRIGPDFWVTGRLGIHRG